MGAGGRMGDAATRSAAFMRPVHPRHARRGARSGLRTCSWGTASGDPGTARPANQSPGRATPSGRRPGRSPSCRAAPRAARGAAAARVRGRRPCRPARVRGAPACWRSRARRRRCRRCRCYCCWGMAALCAWAPPARRQKRRTSRHSRSTAARPRRAAVPGKRARRSRAPSQRRSTQVGACAPPDPAGVDVQETQRLGRGSSRHKGVRTGSPLSRPPRASPCGPLKPWKDLANLQRTLPRPRGARDSCHAAVAGGFVRFCVCTLTGGIRAPVGTAREVFPSQLVQGCMHARLGCQRAAPGRRKPHAFPFSSKSASGMAQPRPMGCLPGMCCKSMAQPRHQPRQLYTPSQSRRRSKDWK